MTIFGEAVAELVNGRPVVTRADDRIEMAGDLYRKADGINMRIIEQTSDGTLVLFGTPGLGLGRVVYRVIDRVRDTDTYHLERIA